MMPADPEYYPGDDFPDAMHAHIALEGEECEYVPCTFRTPDYSVLDPRQRMYYFYWRSMERNGRFLRCDNGYMWIRLCEIINFGAGYDADMQELSALHENYKYLHIRDLIKSAMIDHAIVHDRDFPQIWIWGWDERRFMALSEAMASPPDDMDYEFLRRLAGNPEPAHPDQGAVEDLLNLTLKRVDSRMVMDTGRGISETYGDRTGSEVEVYRGLYFTGDRDYIIEYTDLKNKAFQTFMLGAFRYCEQRLFAAAGFRGPPAPSEFGNSMRKQCDRALEDLMSGEDVSTSGVKAFRGTLRIPVNHRERLLLEVGRELGVEDRFDEYDDYEHGFESPVDEEPSPDCRYDYVPSGSMMPDFRQMDAEQKGFYFTWKSDMREGLHGKTDGGYVWLYLCELVNSESDPEDVLADLASLYDGYGDEWGELIGSVHCDYALVNGLVPDPSLRCNDCTAGLGVRALLSGELPEISSPDVFLYLADTDEEYITERFDRDCAGIASGCLREIDGMVDPEGGIERLCKPVIRTFRCRPFPLIACFDELKRCKLCRYPDFAGSGRFRAGLVRLMRNVAKAVAAHNGEKASPRSTSCFGVDCKPIILEKTAEWFSSARREREEIVLDSDAVEDAAEALRSVTDMMSSGCGDEVEDEAPERVPVRKGGSDPVSAFIGSLEDDELDALKASLGGNPLKGRGSSRLEDSINTKAMDSIGDTVMQNGYVFDEYAREIERKLR